MGYIIDQAIAPAYKIYSALITQSGSQPPIATVFENTLGFLPTWIRDSTGLYSSNEPEWITPVLNRKVMAFISPVAYQQQYDVIRISATTGSSNIVIVTGRYNSVTGFFTYKDTLLRDDDNFQATSIEIRIYE
jgi:hypothetical protein